eukprot:191638_1
MQKNELDGGNDKNEIQNQRECTKVQFVHTNLCHEAVQERYYNDSRDDAMTTLHTSDRFGVNSIDISGDYINYLMIAEHQRRLFVGNRPRRNRKKVKYGFDDLLKREQENASYDQWVGKPESRILDDGMKSRAGRTMNHTSSARISPNQRIRSTASNRVDNQPERTRVVERSTSRIHSSSRVNEEKNEDDPGDDNQTVMNWNG